MSAPTLKALIEKATPGPWSSETDDLGTWINNEVHPAPIAKMGKCTHFDARSNAAFIARCNPATLLAVYEALEFYSTANYAVSMGPASVHVTADGGAKARHAKNLLNATES